MRVGKNPRSWFGTGDDRPADDHDGSAPDALEEHFWGRSAGWVRRSHDALEPTHDGDLDGDLDDRFDDIDTEAPTRPAGISVRRRLRDSDAVARLNDRFGFDSIDPLITRTGMILVAALVALPFVWANRDVEAEGVPVATAPPAVDIASPSVAVAPAEPVVTIAPLPSLGVESTSAPAPAATTPATTVAPAPEPIALQAAEVAPDTAPATPATTLPPCGSTYTVLPGDSWSLVADRASIRMRDLLAVNGASTSSMLYPDDEICLPVGARVVIPTTTAPRRATTTAPATAAPAATTTVPLPPAPSRAEAEAIIREVWPDDLEERALEIVHRESRFNANAQNWCCVGLFQIHWNAHKRWLSGIGITERRQLFDARTNATAAYALYQRNGWSPWDL